MRVLITGATGFVGQNLLPKLLKANHDILEITISPEISQKLYDGKTKQFHFHNNETELRQEIDDFNPAILIHLASYLTASDDTESMKKLIESNVYFLCQVLNGIKDSKLKWFINTGSFAEFFKGDGSLDPAYLYAATKTAARVLVDYYSKAYDFKYMTIAPYTIFGGIDTQKKIIDIIYDSLNCNEPLNLTPGDQVLDFIHIDDVTDFYITCINNLDKIPDKSSFQLGTGRGHTLKEIVSFMEKITNKTANINWGGKPYRPRDVMYAVANISQQHHLFKWKPKIQLEDGIKNYLENKKLNEINK